MIVAKNSYIMEMQISLQLLDTIPIKTFLFLSLKLVQIVAEQFLSLLEKLKVIHSMLEISLLKRQVVHVVRMSPPL